MLLRVSWRCAEVVCRAETVTDEVTSQNWVFQKRTYQKDAKWMAIKSVPTLTPGQAYGYPEKEVRALQGKQKRPSILTVV